MPGNISYAAPSSVMPFTLCTMFQESRSYDVLYNQYSGDGTQEIGQLAQSSRRMYKLSADLTAAKALALKAFYDSVEGGLKPFYFYNPFEVGLGVRVGANYDPTGKSAQGRVTVVFRGSWAQNTQMMRTMVSNLQLVEVD